MNFSEPPAAASSSWEAELRLGFALRGARSTLVQRSHRGPLVVQKALYPEGDEVCHAIILHPPGGIAGGDQLKLVVAVEQGAAALLTTPGAGKWYRSAGPEARQELVFDLAPGASLEWLPQETIVFNEARARMENRVRLAEGARYLGWEVLCLGRRAAGESFASGGLDLFTRIELEGRPLWLEKGRLEGGSPLLTSPVGLGGKSVCATFLVAGAVVAPSLVAACREIQTTESGAQGALTALPRLLVARYLGHSSEAAKDWLTEIWRCLRPALLEREAVPPRIWKT
jgi:urease accessory protein